MQRTLGPVVLLIASIAGLAGCDSGRGNLPKVTVTTVHAASGYNDIRFLRVEREETTLSYRGADSHVFDADTYKFNLEVEPVDGSQSGRIASFTETLVEGNRYIFTFVDVAGLLQALVTGAPLFDSESADARIQIIDAASSIAGPVDVYLHGDAGDDLSAIAPLATVDFLDSTDPVTYQPGTYHVTVTEAGDTSAVVFEQNVTLDAGRAETMILVNSTNLALSSLSAIVLDPTPTALIDLNAGTAVRVINAVNDKMARDVYLGDASSAPLIAAAPYGEATDYADVPVGTSTLTTTPAGQPGSIEIEGSLAASPEVSYTELLTGDSNGVIGSIHADQRRPLEQSPSLTVIDGAANFSVLQISLTEAGADVQNPLGVFFVARSDFSTLDLFPPGIYDIYLVDPASNVVAGPFNVDLEAGRTYTLLVLDDDNNTSAAKIVPIDGFD